MKRLLVIEFTKMNGAGNDFVVLDNRFYHFSDDELSALARRMCPRRVAIGADGLLAVNEASDPDVHYRMRYFNADGSLATMCGNGARCLARFARSSGMMAPTLRFQSDAGLFRAAFPDEDPSLVRIFFPPPKDFEAEHALDAQNLPINNAHTIWTGTEHAVLLVGDVDEIPVEEWGRVIRHDPSLLPEGANVDFVEILHDGRDGEEASLRVRTYERGVEEETLACGTGALAAGVVARLLGEMEGSAVRIEMAGGTLLVGFTLSDGEVNELFLEGPTETVFRGTYELDPKTLSEKK